MKNKWYENISKQIRKEKTKLTIEQVKQVEEVYKKAFDSIAKQLEKGGYKELDGIFLQSYKNELKKELKSLKQELTKLTENATHEGAKLGTKLNQELTKEMLLAAGILDDKDFKNNFNKIQDNVVRDIIKGNLYKDHKTLDERIWKLVNKNGQQIQDVIAQGMAEQKSAIKLAEDLEEFLKPAAQRSVDWGEIYADVSKNVMYNAQTLARTVINHSYQNATIQSTQDNPFIEGIRWESAMQHGRTCEECMDRDGVVYPKDEVPLDHPNGMCTMIPEIPKSLAEIGSEIGRWVNGEENKQLDEWYDK